MKISLLLGSCAAMPALCFSPPDLGRAGFNDSSGGQQLELADTEGFGGLTIDDGSGPAPIST